MIFKLSKANVTPFVTLYLNSIVFKSDFCHSVCNRVTTINVLKFGTLLFLFSNEMLVFMAESHKMLDRIANREDPDQTASSEAV